MTSRVYNHILTAAVIGAAATVPVAGAVMVAPRTATVAQECPNSLTESIWVAGCLPGVDPPADMVDQRGPNQLPTLRGIPCGTDCLGLSRVLGEQETTVPEPDTTVRNSP